MDPVSAIGLASSVVQLITFSTDIISKSREIHRSAAGSLVENVELETIARTLQSQSRRLAAHASKDRFPSGTSKDIVACCEEVRKSSKELIDTVEGLGGDGASSRWKSFYQALKSVWKEQDIADYLRRLEMHRRQIDSLLLMHLQERLAAFTQTAEDRNAKIEENFARLLEEVKPESRWQSELFQNARHTLINTTGVANFDDFSASLSDGAKQDRERAVRGRMLESLKFADMKDRYEVISEAHKRTFDWVFHESNDFDELDEGWDNFADWVRSNKPLYWLTGKPGSGKSTLMKYLSDDPRLKSNLMVWERQKPVCEARFFLWNSGSAMQMSRMGLIQSLLYQTLCEVPHKISRIFSERWEYSEYFGYDHRPWSWVELSGALKKVIDDEERNFVFLIDGLDELDGDCAELASFLLGILEARSNVKMCIASRPWLVFEDAFRRRPSLRMEDLTKKDIQRFASEKLGEHPMFAQLEEIDGNGSKVLIDEVTEKSAGVFLWVRLVVKSLLEGLRDGDTLEDLQARLLLLPRDLEALFKKILDDLDPAYFEEASQFLQLVRASHISQNEVVLGAKDHLPSKNDPRQHELDNRSSLTLLTLSFAREDSERAFLKEFSKPLKEKQKLYRAETTRRRIASRCKGLLEVSNFKKDGPDAKVQYLHRTVRDFLCEASAQKILTDWTTDFDPHVALCAALIRHTKAIHPKEHDDKGMNSFESLLKHFVTQCHCIERAGSHEYVRYLDEMDWVTVGIPGYGSHNTAPYGLPHWTRRVDPFIGKRKKVKSVVDYAFERHLNAYLLAKLDSGYAFVPTGDSYMYLLRRAEEAEDGTLLELLMQRGPKQTLAPPSAQRSRAASHDGPAKGKLGAWTQTRRARTPDPGSSKEVTQDRGVFGFRKGLRSVSDKLHLSR